MAGDCCLHRKYRSQRYSALRRRSDGTIVIGTDTDVLSYRDGSWTSLLGQDALSIASAEVLFEDRDGDLWVGCGLPTRGGLYRLNGTTWSSFSISDGLPHLSVRGITQARDGTIWVATGFSRHGGAARYSGGEMDQPDCTGRACRRIHTVGL